MSTYDLTQTTPGKLQTGDILNCPYSGAEKSITLPPGRYKLEVWGAEGGYRSSTTYGGKGGYSVGTLTITTALLLFLFAGGSGNTGKTAGGFNGGGKRSTYNGGGGASDIRLGQNSLYARVLVAAGGGSDGAANRAGAAGGGTTGGTASSGYGSGDDDKGGGGGSGYVYTAATAGNYPSGCLLTSDHYLADASTTAGTSSFMAPGGASETGHSGDGYVRITALEVYPQTPAAPGNFRQTAKDYFSMSLAWDEVSDATSYKLYRDGTLLATLTETSYTDTGLQPSTAYTYTVTGVNAEGEGDPATLTAETEEGWVVQLVEITQAAFAPNPANINSKTVLSVEVTETIKLLEPYYYYSGDLYAGEV